MSKQVVVHADSFFNEIQELLAFCASTRASVNRLNACTCTKGIGITRKQRRFCDFCQALAGFGEMRRRLEKLKGIFRPNESQTETKTDKAG